MYLILSLLTSASFAEVHWWVPGAIRYSSGWSWDCKWLSVGARLTIFNIVSTILVTRLDWWMMLWVLFTRITSWLWLLWAFLLKLYIFWINWRTFSMSTLFHSIQIQRVLILCGSFDIFKQTFFFEIVFNFSVVFMLSHLCMRIASLVHSCVVLLICRAFHVVTARSCASACIDSRLLISASCI